LGREDRSAETGALAKVVQRGSQIGVSEASSESGSKTASETIRSAGSSSVRIRRIDPCAPYDSTTGL